jgi:hypothetical protein
MYNFLINRDYRIIFGWTPKANCTTIAKMFFNEINLLDRALEYNPWIHEYKDRIYCRSMICNTNDLCNNNYLKIKFVRCPYDRAVSSFLFIAEFLPENARTFELFLETLINGKFVWNDIIKCENIDEEIIRINNKYNRKFIHKFNSDHWNTKRDNNSNEYLGDIYYNNELKNNNYKKFYNDKSRALVERFYNDDISYYGYTFDEFIIRNS